MCVILVAVKSVPYGEQTGSPEDLHLHEEMPPCTALLATTMGPWLEFLPLNWRRTQSVALMDVFGPESVHALGTAV